MRKILIYPKLPESSISFLPHENARLLRDVLQAPVVQQLFDGVFAAGNPERTSIVHCRQNSFADNLLRILLHLRTTRKAALLLEPVRRYYSEPLKFL